MKIPPNIARNTALKENVFMMVVCIELKIPLFMVGKPGSSKSLAKSIVADSMQGAASSSSLFQRFKQVYYPTLYANYTSGPTFDQISYSLPEITEIMCETI